MGASLLPALTLVQESSRWHIWQSPNGRGHLYLFCFQMLLSVTKSRVFIALYFKPSSKPAHYLSLSSHFPCGSLGPHHSTPVLLTLATLGCLASIPPPLVQYPSFGSGINSSTSQPTCFRDADSFPVLEVGLVKSQPSDHSKIVSGTSTRTSDPIKIKSKTLAPWLREKMYSSSLLMYKGCSPWRYRQPSWDYKATSLLNRDLRLNIWRKEMQRENPGSGHWVARVRLARSQPYDPTNSVSYKWVNIGTFVMYDQNILIQIVSLPCLRSSIFHTLVGIIFQ